MMWPYDTMMHVINIKQGSFLPRAYLTMHTNYFHQKVSANRNLVTSGTQIWSSGMSRRTSVISRHVELNGRGDPTESRQYLQRLITGLILLGLAA